MNKFNIDERIEAAVGDRQIMNDDRCGECTTSTSEVSLHIKQLIRDVLEYVKPERAYISSRANIGLLHARNKTIDEMDTKAKELGL